MRPDFLGGSTPLTPTRDEDGIRGPPIQGSASGGLSGGGGGGGGGNTGGFIDDFERDAPISDYSGCTGQYSETSTAVNEGDNAGQWVAPDQMALEAAGIASNQDAVSAIHYPSRGETFKVALKINADSVTTQLMAGVGWALDTPELESDCDASSHTGYELRLREDPGGFSAALLKDGQDISDVSITAARDAWQVFTVDFGESVADQISVSHGGAEIINETDTDHDAGGVAWQASKSDSPSSTASFDAP